MAAGALQNVIACVPVTSGPSVAPCATISGVKQKPVMQIAYVINPASADFFDMAVEPLNSIDAAKVFGVAFTMVLLCFMVARGIGTILDMIRKG
ncbi:hypothetical protein BH11PSE12_BH11PSE12_20660 [soil metagenome]